MQTATAPAAQEDPMTDDADKVWICLHVEMSSSVGSESRDYVSVARAEWEAMTEDERGTWMDEALQDHISNSISGSHWLVDEDEVPLGDRNR